MSKKKNNNNGTVNETAEVAENVEDVETPVEETNVEATPVEEVTKDEAPVEPVEPEESVIETPVVEKELGDVEFEEVETEPEPVAPVAPEVPVAVDLVKVADPLPEVNGNYYVNFGDMSDRKEVKVKAAIEKCGYNHIVTATGEVLAGSFATDYDANVARKKIAGLGFKGVVYTFE